MIHLPPRPTLATMLLLLVLIVPVFLACGGDDNNEDLSTPPTAGAPTAMAGDDDDATPATDDIDASPPTGTTDTFGPFTVEDLLFGKAIETPEHEGGVLVQGGSQNVSTLLPVVTQDGPSTVVQGFIFESLVSVHPDTLEPIGLLAESWDVNEDASVYTFHLRDDISWSDGEPFTAEDVEFTYLTYMNPDTGSPNVSNISAQIDSVDVLEPLTVRFILTGTFPDFAVDIMVFNIIAKHIWEDIDPAAMQHDPGATGTDPSRVVGTGPFMVDEWVTGDHLTLVRNENYWRGAPALDTFIFKVLPDDATAVNQLKTGEIDWGGVPPSAVREFDGNQDVAVIDFPTLEFTFYGLNLNASKTTLFQDVEVRQALLYALDREAMLDSILFGYGEVAVGTIPTMSWAYNPDGIELKYPYDPEMAKQLLDDAGWNEGADGVREKGGQRLAFTIYTNAGDQVRESYLTVLQEYWAEIGVEMTPQFEPFPVLIERLTETSDFEAFLVGFTWGAAVDQSIMFTCDAVGGNGFNFTSYCNPEVDAILSEALSKTDRDRRIQLYTEFQNIVMEDLPETILFFSRNIDGVSRRVHNLFPNGVNFLFNAHTWWIED
jgi:peptide/nickel transport system substrate-binding protein